jgi:hypothetical protein
VTKVIVSVEKVPEFQHVCEEKAKKVDAEASK